LKLYDATPAWLIKNGLNGNDARRLSNALNTLADFEGKIEDALVQRKHQRSNLSNVCDALRYLVDGKE